MTHACPDPTCNTPLPDTAAACPKCGRPSAAATVSMTADAAAATVTAPPAAGDAPATIGRFRVDGFLGEGAFGRVYKAYDPQLDRAVALKVAKPEQLHTPQRVQRFLREAKAAANLRHPNVVAVYDSGRDDHGYYIASQFIDGTNLERRLAGGAVPPFAEAAALVRKLAEALAYAHRQGVVHRDVKPANVMVDAAGEPLLMDFGLAARGDGEERLTGDGAVLGTPAYMAPEQAAGAPGPASDQYALGVTLYEMLTGRLPFRGGTPAQFIYLHQTQPPPRPRSVNRAVPKDLEAVCLKCLEKEPQDRYSSCEGPEEDVRR